MLVEKVQQDEHTREHAKEIQTLNLKRSKLKNAINEYFDQETEIKV